MHLAGFAVCEGRAAPSCTMWGQVRCTSEVSLSVAAAVMCTVELWARVLEAAALSCGR